MEAQRAELVWRGVEDANPWWTTGRVPPKRSATLRRHAFPTIYEALSGAEEGRGVVLLGPRRVGKSVLLHQIVEGLLTAGTNPIEICLLSLDDVALRDADLGELLALVDARKPLPPGRKRVLLLDEVQHAQAWSGWLKRIADRRDPCTFLATGSSATALQRRGQDAGVGRWREMTLFPWSFREHVELRKLEPWHATEGPPSLAEREKLDAALVDYFIRGGFPEVAVADDVTEARRRLRQDILDRALGRDITDTMNVDTKTLERLFLRICLAPGGLWSEVEASRDLQVSRPTVAKYVQILERAFLVFLLPNLATPIKGQPKAYLVAPAMRQALLALDETAVRNPHEWGPIAENVVAATVLGTNREAQQIGFWRRGNDECDVVALNPDGGATFHEVKHSGRKAVGGIQRAAESLGVDQSRSSAVVLTRDHDPRPLGTDGLQVQGMGLAVWLSTQRASAGGTLRMRTD